MCLTGFLNFSAIIHFNYLTCTYTEDTSGNANTNRDYKNAINENEHIS